MAPLTNNGLVNPGYNSIATDNGYALISGFNSYGSLREMARLIALSLGAPVQFIANAASTNTHTFAAMLYMYEMEYMGGNGELSTWGPEYTDVLQRERIRRYFSSNVTATDILCCSFNALKGNSTSESYLIFNKFIEKMGNAIDADRFGNFILFLIKNGALHQNAFTRLLNECESGKVLKGVMDAINGCKTEPIVRDALTRLRDSANFADISRAVTTKIAAAMQTAQ